MTKYADHRKLKSEKLLTPPRSGQHLALLIPSLAGGGVARVVLQLAAEFAQRRHRVDLVVCRPWGPYRHRIPANVTVIELKPEPDWRARARTVAADWKSFGALLLPVLLPFKGAGTLPYLADLVRYLEHERPNAVFSAKTHTNLLALWARRIAAGESRMVISERTNLSQQIRGPHGRKWRWRFIRPVIHRVYPWADAIVSVSDGVADDLCSITGINRQRITTIYNPAVTSEVLEEAKAPLAHPWFHPDAPPVVLAAGRIAPQKDFPTLLRAFARVRKAREARLLILGEGKRPERRGELLRLAAQLGVVDDVALPGFVDNPPAYMARAAVFVLSSTWEGLPGVLIQALACGCPVVSTDCQSGPAEILASGEYGSLVPVGDDAALADAIVATLDGPTNRERLAQRGALFSADRSVEQHLQILLGPE